MTKIDGEKKLKLMKFPQRNVPLDVPHWFVNCRCESWVYPVCGCARIAVPTVLIMSSLLVLQMKRKTTSIPPDQIRWFLLYMVTIPQQSSILLLVWWSCSCLTRWSKNSRMVFTWIKIWWLNAQTHYFHRCTAWTWKLCLKVGKDL